MPTEPTVILCGVPQENKAGRKPPIRGRCRACFAVHELCPECFGPVFSVYGLGAANGMGLYWVCDDCDYHYAPPAESEATD